MINMKMAVCEHPVRIRDRQTNQYRLVPCGKCSTCLNIKNNIWIDRLIQEAQVTPYVLFFTLTYNENNVPRLFFDGDSSLLVDPDTGLCVNPYDVPNFRPSSRLYLHRRKNIPYCKSSDVQMFMKRLRYYAKNLTLHTNENSQIRYFIVSEYGPTTYRPHYHGLLFFFSNLLSKNIVTLLSQSWKNGYIDASYVRDSAATYVAQYINCVSSLPKIYLHRELRPFLLCSKNPPLGSCAFTKEEFYEIVTNGVSEKVLHDWKRGKIKSVPLWRFLKDSLFPRCQGFDNFNHFERVTLYASVRSSSANTFEEFKEWCLKLSHDTFMRNYIASLLMVDDNSSSPGSYYSLRNFYYCCNKVYFNCIAYGIKFHDYITYIENYYNSLSMKKLYEFYQFQEDYVKLHHDARPLIFLYGDFIYSRSFTLSQELNLPESKLVLQSFGYDLDFSLSEQFDFAFRKYLNEYLSMCRINQSILRVSQKLKKKNDYLGWINNNATYNERFTFNLYKHYE